MYEVLKNMRKEKGYTCEQMAKIIGVTRPSYFKKERGEIIFSLPDAKKISDFFGKSIEENFFANNRSN